MQNPDDRIAELEARLKATQDELSRLQAERETIPAVDVRRATGSCVS